MFPHYTSCVVLLFKIELHCTLTLANLDSVRYMHLLILTHCLVRNVFTAAYHLLLVRKL